MHPARATRNVSRATAHAPAAVPNPAAPAALRCTVRSPSNKALQQTKPGRSSRSTGNQSGPKASSAGLLGPPSATLHRQLGASGFAAERQVVSQTQMNDQDDVRALRDNQSQVAA